jgi:PEP-CTERM motif
VCPDKHGQFDESTQINHCKFMNLIQSFNMKKTKIASTITLAVGMALFTQVQLAGAAAQSNSTNNLANLISTGGTLTIGDKTFSNFGIFASGADASELAADASGLNVTASIAGGIYYLDWSGLIGVNNLFGTSPLLGDLQLKYTVTVTGPNVISMIDQNYTPNALPAGGQIIIGETAKNILGAIVGNSTLTLNPTDLSDPAPEPGDNLNINPGEQQLFVTKDIFIAAATGQFVGLSDVEQSFHQVAAVPEPASVKLILFGLAALAGFQGLRRKKVLD